MGGFITCFSRESGVGRPSDIGAISNVLFLMQYPYGRFLAIYLVAKKGPWDAKADSSSGVFSMGPGSCN